MATTGGDINPWELKITKVSNHQIIFVIIMIDFVLFRFKSIPLGPLVGFSGTQLKGKKPIFVERFSLL
jgi:hypothetical protein